MPGPGSIGDVRGVADRYTFRVTVQIQSATIDQLPAILSIYNQAVEERATGDLRPVTVDERIGWFNEHEPRRYPLRVAILETGEVVGWVSLGEYRFGRAAFRRTAEISYYVDREHRRRGIATQLIDDATGLARSLGYRTLVALLLESNDASIRLLRQHGYAEWGRMRATAIHDGHEQDHLYYGRPLDG